jgi:Family of unknown function (DUF5755)
MALHHKKCPPGVICIENVSLFFLTIVVFIAFYLIYVYMMKQPTKNISQQPQNQSQSQKIVIQDERNSGYGFGYGNDVLMNPYVPPLRDEGYFVPPLTTYSRPLVPINVSTSVRALDTNYRQVGLLTPVGGGSDDKILPLMGRPLLTNRSMWQYYSMSNQNNSVKLPIRKGGRSCTNENGCNELMNGENVFVEGYNQAFRVTLYDNDSIRYIPYL